MKRIKRLEYPWIFKDSFMTTGYTFLDREGNKYVIWAKDMANAEELIRLRDLSGKGTLANAYQDWDTARNFKPYFNGDGEVHVRPFWYYGRVYQLN